MSDFPSGSSEGADDRVLPFQVDELDLRGRIVRLGPAIDALLVRHAYPAPVSRVLGEAVVLTVLLGSALKFEGRFQLQTQSDGAIDMLVVDFEAPDRIRGYARFDEARVAEESMGRPSDTGRLLGRGHLALTIDQGPDMLRYQGVVELTGVSFEEAAHQYFRQSEQIPTRVRLAVAEAMRGDGGFATHWRAGGLLAQFLPDAPERARQADLDPGDAPEGYEGPDRSEDDAWVEAQSLVATIEDDELTDPTLAPERLLLRLFHQHDVRVFADQEVREACRCSRERIFNMLRSFTAEERDSMIADDGSIDVTCEFCNTHYHFAPSEFAAGPAQPNGSGADD